jgi:hypothetical protein
MEECTMKKIILWLVVVCFAFLASHDGSAQQRKFMLSCRGQLDYVVGTGGNATVIFFTKNPTKSNNGQSLRPGSCAWTDRPVAASEPSKIYLYPETGDKVRASFIAFTQCAADSNCYATFLAYNAFSPDNPHFRVEERFVFIRYLHRE